MTNYAKSLSKTLALALLFLVGAVSSAMATVKFSIVDLSIAAGETKEVAVNMENDEAVTSVQFNLQLPTGLTVVANSFKAADRFGGYTVFGDQLSDGSIRVSALCPNLEGVAAGNGTIVTFQVTASDELASDATITLGGQTAAKPNSAGGGKADSEAENGTVTKDVTPTAGFTVTASPAAITLVGESEQTIEIALDNGSVNLWGLQGTLKLPAGVTLVGGKVEADSRLSAGFSLSTTKKSEQEYSILATTLTSSDPDEVHITGSNGTVLKFTVKGSSSVADGSTITLTNLTSVQKVGSTNKLVNLNSVNITISTVDQANEDAYTALTAQIDALQAKLDDAKKSIAENDADVADQFTTQEAAIQQEIDDLRATIDQQHDNGQLNASSNIDSDVNAISAEIDQLVADADAAQQQTQVNQDNEDAYARLTAQLDALQKQLDNAKKALSTTYAAVGNSFDADVADIQRDINALRADVETRHNNGELDANSYLNTQPIADAISALTANAAEAIAEQQKAEANEAAYEKLSDQVDALQKQLDEAKATIASDYADVADQFAAQEQDIQNQIDALKRQLEQQYNNTELTAASTIDSAAVSAAIAQLLADAAKAEAIKNVIPGNVDDSNDVVDGDDLEKLITAILTKQLPAAGTADFYRYDVNGDGEINITDAMAIQNLIVWGNIYGENGK